MTYEEIIVRLEAMADPEAVAGMARYGIRAAQTYGVPVPELRKLGREIGCDHELAQRLWAQGSREARLLAGLTADPRRVTEELLESWAAAFDNWEICDGTCMNLVERLPFAYRKAVEWSNREGEYVKRAGFVLMARLAVSDKKAADVAFEPFFALIRREATDPRDMVKKGVNWALRQIGKRSLALHAPAVALAEELAVMDDRNARWVGRDALRELQSEAVRRRLWQKEEKRSPKKGGTRAVQATGADGHRGQ